MVVCFNHTPGSSGKLDLHEPLTIGMELGSVLHLCIRGAIQRYLVLHHVELSDVSQHPHLRQQGPTDVAPRQPRYNRVEQFPDIATTFLLQFDGTWASTLRYHEGTFYVITAFVTVYNFNPHILLFNATDPYSDDAWSDPWQIPNPTYGADPDIFFDDAGDGSVYVTVSNGTGPWSITQYHIDLPAQQVLGEPAVLWNGNGESSPEGPHIYYKDDYYWLLVANGGTGMNHSIAMLRSETVDGSYDFYEGNPVLTNRGTEEYYQTVGHGDLFQDPSGNWWGVARI